MKYNIYVPSGNPTALVIGISDDLNLRKKINDEIIKKHNNFVEQVGFVSEDKNKHCLLMAGGEFCGNATRSAIYYYLDGAPGEIDIEILELNMKLHGGIIKNNTWVDMPIIKNCIKANDDKSYIVKLPGITHLVIEYDSLNDKDKENLSDYSKEMLKKYNLQSELAAGIMYIKRENSKIYLLPYVWVNSINTWFYETACGSGTTAVGIYESYISKESIDLDIMQPSNEIINIKTKYKDDEVTSARISGIVKLYDTCELKIGNSIDHIV